MLDAKYGQGGVVPRSFTYQFVTLFFARLWQFILHVFRVLAVVLGMIFCVGAALFATDLLYGSHGSPIVHGAAILAILLLALAIFLRKTCSLSLWAMVASLALAECITLTIIGGCTGYKWFDILNPYNLYWMARMNLSIALPWMLGMAIGSIRRKQPTL